MLVLSAIGALGGLSLLLASGLVLANRTLFVEEDPRFDRVESMLPGTNCGACGFPGCRALAEALVTGEAQPAKCTVSTEEGRASIADFLGVDVGQAVRRVARLACAGGANVARRHAHYIGHESCRGAALIAGGGKGCFWGCLGYGDCEAVCDFDAIVMDEHGLPHVVESACTACGDCVDACPKDLFSIHPEQHRLWVACKNLEFGDDILAECQVGCTACGRCAKDAPGLVSIEGNLAVVDYSFRQQDHAAGQQAIERCPTGAIVWINDDGTTEKGGAAAKVVRHSPLPVAPT